MATIYSDGKKSSENSFGLHNPFKIVFDDLIGEVISVATPYRGVDNVRTVYRREGSKITAEATGDMMVGKDSPLSRFGLGVEVKGECSAEEFTRNALIRQKEKRFGTDCDLLGTIPDSDDLLFARECFSGKTIKKLKETCKPEKSAELEVIDVEYRIVE